MIKTQPHYVKENKTCRVPRRWVYFDTEANVAIDGRREEQSWRLGVTSFEHRDNTKREWIQPDVRRWTDPQDLWDYVGSCAKKGSRTVVVAHNIGYDLRLSNALQWLPAMGWELKMMSIGGRNLTMTFTRNGATLCFIDFTSWVPGPLTNIGTMVGAGKLDLPDQAASEDEWFARCERDVEILRLANREIVEWIERDDLGNWQRTGAGMAWSNWRHRHYTDKVLAHGDDEARELEVIATGAARCEAWRHGKLTHGPWVEWDLPLAYPRVCLGAQLPTVLLGHNWKPRPENYAEPRPGQRVILTATVTTEAPILPVQGPDGWLWPVGTFTSSWWDDELRLAIDRGATVELHHAVHYKAAPALAKWAEWVVTLVEGSQDAYTPLQRAVTKHWGRAFIGRFGAKFPRWDYYGGAPDGHLDLSGFYDYDTGAMGQLMTLGGSTYIGLEKDWIADANPAIMGAILSECRVRLWHIIEAAGAENVVYMDTDSVIVTPEGNRRLQTWTDHGQGWGVRVKGRYRHLEILGPRQMIVEGHGRISGLPKRAVNQGNGEWVGERWDGVEASLSSPRPDVVVVRDVLWKVKGIDNRRRHLAKGATEPVRVSL